MADSERLFFKNPYEAFLPPSNVLPVPEDIAESSYRMAKDHHSLLVDQARERMTTDGNRALLAILDGGKIWFGSYSGLYETEFGMYYVAESRAYEQKGLAVPHVTEWMRATEFLLPHPAFYVPSFAARNQDLFHYQTLRIQEEVQKRPYETQPIGIAMHLGFLRPHRLLERAVR